MDLTWLANPVALAVCHYVALAGLIVYVTGSWLWLALPVVCFVQVAINSLYNSRGYTFHGHQLVGLALLAQTVVVLVLLLFINPAHWQRRFLPGGDQFSRPLEPGDADCTWRHHRRPEPDSAPLFACPPP